MPTKLILIGLVSVLLLAACDSLQSPIKSLPFKIPGQAPPPLPSSNVTIPITDLTNATNSTNSTNTTSPPPIPQLINPPFHQGKLTAYYINVGHGDAALIVGPNNGTMLINCGPVGYGPKIENILFNLGFPKLDTLVVSNMNDGNVGGCADVIVKLKPSTIYDNGRTVDSEAFRLYKSAFSSQNNYKKVGLDVPFAFDNGVSANFIVPYDDNQGFSPYESDNSILVRMQQDVVSFLFAGGCSSDCEPRILDSDLQADALKVGDFGSSNTSSTLFLNRVLPSYAIISSDGNPSADVLERLHKVGAIVHQTSSDGTIILSTEGITISVEELR